MRQVFSCAVLVCALVLVACQAPEPFASSILPTPEATFVPLPPPTSETEPTASVAPAPQPSATGLVALHPNFRLEPLTSDSREATGQGPVGFTLVIVDATSGAKMLGTGQPDLKGNFRIELNQVPAKGHLVGLTIDLTKEQLGSEEFMRRLFDIRGPGFRMIPQVVTVYDSYPVP
jgi:hypothetical protein